jgi:hypothetical protein
MLAVVYATGRASHARQVKGDDPDKKGYPGPPGWGFGVRLTTPQSKKKLIITKVEQRKKLDRFNYDVQKRKTQERMERRSRKRSSSAGSKKMERVADR